MSTIRHAFDQAYANRAPLFGVGEASLVAATADILPEDSLVLDLGCGDGRNSLFLLEQGLRVRAVDFAESGIRYLEEQAEERGLAKGLTAEVADIRELQLDRDEFDGILAITVLENLAKPEQQTLMDHLRLACRSGGVIAIESHSNRDPAVNSSTDRVTEFGDTIIGPMRRNELLGYFHSWRILHYHDIVFEDTSHGEPHDHGRVGIIAQNTQESVLPTS